MAAFRPIALTGASLLMVFALSSCQRSVSGLDTRGVADPLPPAPIGGVQSSQLDPAAPALITPDQQVAAVDPNIQPQATLAPGTQVPGTQTLGTDPAATVTTPPVNSAPVSRESVTGTWVVASDNPECRIILAFTKWAGGYRAATRRCETTEMGAISAWDVKDNKVVLIDANGNQVASLASSGPERYDGATAGGKTVSFSR